MAAPLWKTKIFIISHSEF